MKVQIWDEQASLFEMTVLAATAELVPATLEDMITNGLGHPLALVGRALAPSHEESLRRLASAAYRGQYPMVVVPPFGDATLHRYLDLPLNTVLVRRPPTSATLVVDTDWVRLVGQSPIVRSDHFIDTALSAGHLVMDDGGHLVALRHQPRNTSGVVIITTLLVLAHTALSEEDDRQKVLEALLGWRSPFSLSDTAELEAEAEELTPSREEAVPVLLALTVARHAEPMALIHTADAYLGASPGQEVVKVVLRYLERQGVVRQMADVGSEPVTVVNQERLQQIIDQLGLHAYAREMMELAAERGGEVA